jgi:protein gp37
MGENTEIEWTDATVNFWWGCTKVGPGCDHCYAEGLANRFGTSWGLGMPRRQIAGAQDTLAKLNRQGGKRVFIQSMSDLFDNEVPVDWFDKAWGNIVSATTCRIQIVTKRISMVEKRLAAIGATHWPQNAGLMITVVNQDEANRDIPRLLALKAKLGIPWVGLSMEPLLGPVDLEGAWHGESALDAECWGECAWCEKGFTPLHNCQRGRQTEAQWQSMHSGLDWVIVGGESGPKARPMHPDWARSLRDQCQAAGVPFFFKQWGEWAPPADPPPWRNTARAQWHDACGLIFDTIAKPDPLTFFSEGAVYRLGKARAGRLLDGREWNDMPGALT